MGMSNADTRWGQRENVAGYGELSVGALQTLPPLLSRRLTRRAPALLLRHLCLERRQHLGRLSLLPAQRVQRRFCLRCVCRRR